MKKQSAAGFTAVELLVVITILAVLAVLSFHHGGELLTRQRLESSSRRIALGIERGRLLAQRMGQPCGLSLGPSGWGLPVDASAGCMGAQLGKGEGLADGSITINHNLPAVVRFTANGLVLDGGTVVITAAGSQLKRCLVMALPLGIVRLGRYGADPRLGLRAEACLPDLN